MARTTSTRRAVAGAVQIRLETDLTGEDYVKRQAWRDASAPECPWHGAPCELAPHGTYERRPPPGSRVRRFRCLQSGRTISLLLDCLAAHLSGTLAEIEATVRAVDESPTLRKAAQQLRTGEMMEPGAAERWTRRRALLVQVLYSTIFRRACFTLGRRDCYRKIERIRNRQRNCSPTP